ncbi:MAG: PKD domain-containing protein, partial [Bacteroidota bacterium]
FGDGNTSTAQNPTHSYSTPGTYTVSLTVTNVLACSDTESRTNVITVRNGPDAEFVMSDTINCAPLAIDFTDLSVAGDAPIVVWNWEFGDGIQSLAQNTTHIYNTPGTYTVRLTTIDANGCFNQDSTTVQALEIPVADFVSADTLGCAPQTVSFTNLSTSAYTITYYKWLFGDGDSAELVANPVHAYNTDGIYTVSLIIVDQNGCSDTITKPNYIRLSHPIADFAFSSNQVCPGIPVGVSFTDTSVPDTTLVSWNWDFGDGTTSTQQNPNHSYATPGVYTVRLIVTNILGCSDTISVPNTVNVLTPPTSVFTPSDNDGCMPLAVTFSESSTDGDAAIVSWSWDFGDGNSSLVQNPTYTFPTPGVYGVQLLVTDANGCQDSVSQNITVYDLPSADFVSADTLGCAPQTVNFTDLSSGTPGIVNWFWDFGDGTFATVQNPGHTYAANGQYDVSLVVINAQGCRDTLLRPAYIRLNQPVADFTASSTTICPGAQVSFTDTSIPDTTLVSWLWDFGDGTSSTLQNPSHLYTSSGNYDIRLTVTNVLGCSQTELKTAFIEVQEAPLAQFTVPDVDDCAPFAVSFSNTSIAGSNPIVAWEWNFGTGAGSALENPSYTFLNPGNYDVQLVATNSLACTDTFTLAVEALQLPDANFRASDSVGCAPISITFFDLSTGPAVLTAWEWSFGDGNTSTSPVPVNTYLNNGLYDVSLKVTDINGCEDSLTKAQYIKLRQPDADFTADQTQVCPGVNIQFTDKSVPDTTLLSWSWDFGDGNTSATQNPVHSYSAPGTYTVSLTITNILNCGDAEVKTAFIEVLPPPTPQFTASDTVGCTPLGVSFTDNSFGNPSPIVAWDWNFGNGQTSTAQNPATVFNTPAIYPVALTVTDNNGCTATRVENIRSLVLPQADFRASDTTGCEGVINFFDLSSGPQAITSWKWYFGDGDSALVQNPSHNYQSTGLYTVTLIITDAFGCGDTIERPDYINLTRPIADFTQSETVACPGEEIEFLDASIPDHPIIDWSWDFG